MDMGDVSFSATTSLAAISETTNQEKLYGSGIFFKQEFLSGGTTTTNTEGDLRGLKVAKTVAFDDFSAPKAMHKSSLLRSNSNNFDSSHGSQMLCFSSPNSSQSVTFPFYHSSSNAYAKNAAYGGGMQGTKGSFTPSQWMELEHQALIYKYIHANVPIPSSLLIPIRKALDSAGFSGFMGLRPSTYGWGAYQLGYSSSTDPEPGRCRRTDGKKWRCAKDAMSDHKYCERHMNRGRHRSRKHVERQSGNSVTGTMKTSTTKQMPPMPVASSMSAAVVAAGGSETNSLGLGTNQSLYNAPSALAAPCSASGSGNRNILDKVSFSGKYQDIDGLSMISPSLNFKENQCSIPKPQNASHESSGGEFGQVSFDSLLNPFNKSYGASSEECIDDIKSNKPQNGLHQFFTDWPNNDSQSKSSWQDINMNSERTQLSISIPSTISDFMSSTSSPTNKHSPNLETSTQMDKSRREASWIPVNWESSSIGGPLAEVLNNTNNNNNNINNSVDSGAPSLNLMTGGGWDGSPYMASSPTGVLQKAAFLSSSNSSAGSSPRAAADISKAYIGGVNNLCSNVFVSSHTNPVLPNL